MAYYSNLMRTFLALVLISFSLYLASASGEAMTAVHLVPKNQSQIAGGEWFPYVISKLAPLESWNFSASIDDVKREDYSSDFFYQVARQNTWEFPRFCFSMFRPRVDDWAALNEAIDGYKGGVIWMMHDDCIAAMAATGKTGVEPTIALEEFQQKLEQSIRNPPKPDPEFVRKAMADIPNFCAYLEKNLGLQKKSPVDFDSQWLTREGLAQSRGEFEDFFEAGAWTVFLARDPERYAKASQSTSQADRRLSMGIGMWEQDALFEELGARREGGGEQLLVLPGYPLLSRLDNIASDATYAPDEVSSFLAECIRAEDVVKNPKSIRGLDKLIRVTKWAKSLQLGIYFGGQ
jgi:hypothetical protein